mgnify:CR=1 FL=1
MPNGDSSIADAMASRDAVEEKCPTPVRIRRLLMEQGYAVLCTQSQSQPYGSLIAFAASDDLKTIVFATPMVSALRSRLTRGS